MSGPHPLVLADLSEGGFAGVRVLDTAVLSFEDAEELLAVTITPATWAALRTLGLEDAALQARRLFDLVESRRGRAQAQRRAQVAVPEPEHEYRRRERQALAQVAQEEPAALAESAAKRICVGHWRTARERDLASTADPSERATIEEKVRTKWVGELVAVLQAARLPAVAAADRTADPARTLARCAGNRRGKTVRQRVRAMAPVLRWLAVEKGISWPGATSDMLDYVNVAESTGWAATQPASVRAALGFLEKAGGVPDHDRISLDPVWLTAINDADRAARLGQPPQKPACPLVTSIVMSLELYVVGPHDDFKRFIAWVMLVKLWCGLRTDDTLGIPPALISLDGNGRIEARIERTKTTGAGKKVRWLPIFVSEGASLTGAAWQAEGVRLLLTPEYSFPRDYLVPLTGVDGCPARKMAWPTDIVAYERGVLSELPVPWVAGHQWVQGEDLLIGRVGAGCWSGHSARSWTTSLAAVMQVPSDQWDFLGRWRVTDGGGLYVRTARQVVVDLQDRIVRYVRAGSPLDEGMAYQRYREHLTKMGVDPDGVTAAVDRMCINPATLTSAPVPGTPAEAGDGTITPPLMDEVDAKEPGDAADTYTYWVVYSAKRRHGKLHRWRGCWIQPEGVRDWEGADRLEDLIYHTLCKRCFKDHGPNLGDTLSAAPSSPRTSSESSSTEDPPAEGVA